MLFRSVVLGLAASGWAADLEYVALQVLSPGAEFVSDGSAPRTGTSAGISLATVRAITNRADVLALADAGARVRLTLRNPLDTATRTHTSMSIPSLMQGAGQ